MAHLNPSIPIYQLRILLRRTSPHVWRRIVIPSHFTLSQLHQTIRLVFGWSNAYPCRFVIRGKSFPVDPNSAGESAVCYAVPQSVIRDLDIFRTDCGEH